MLRAVLLDVGGTLWPEKLPPLAGIDPCLEPLSQALPSLDSSTALAAIRRYLQQDDASLEQVTHRLVAAALRSLGGTPSEADAVAVRRALCVPAVARTPLFPGAIELLTTLRNLGLRSVIVSNVEVRGAAEYRRDFADLGVAHLIDSVVTSLDVGFRKPHPAIFKSAILAAGCDATECVMVGNSEAKDIEPAVQLGMRAIRVAIEEPPPITSAADVILTDLGAVRQLIARWCEVA
jgi:HAD superfamily hydrolase (TIGR01509 family)